MHICGAYLELSKAFVKISYVSRENIKKLSWNVIQLDVFVSYLITKEWSLIDHKQHCRTFTDTKKKGINL